MGRIPAKSLKTLLAGVFAVAGLTAFQAGALPAAPTSPQVSVVAHAENAGQADQPRQAQPRQADCGGTSEFERVDLSDLPPEAADTVELVRRDGPYPHPQDDEVFHNREGLLPDCPDGYYREYTVETPGSDDRGARRFVVGEGDEYFYTADHYESFRLTDIHA